MADAFKAWIHIPLDWRRPEVAGSFNLYWDDKEQFGQLRPRPTELQISSYYEVPNYYTHGEHARDRTPESFASRLLFHLAWRADQGQAKTAAWWRKIVGIEKCRILEIGCGSGTNLEALSALGHDVSGMEPDPVARAHARRKGLRVFSGTAEGISERLVGRFDAVIFIHVLEHCIDPTIALRNARSLLKDGGILVAEVPNNACAGIDRFGSCWLWLDVPRHLNFFTERSLSKLATKSGFGEHQVYYTGYCRQFGAEWIACQSKIATLMGKQFSTIDYWKHLIATSTAPDARKYDSVGIVCTAL